uniref:Uncharacterized protein n=1 Tax=Anopheles funestus TaxID=62324 RepID=A0A4Y0BFC2_ANOFN
MYFRSLYWILAAAVLLVVTTVLTASVPNDDVYHENTLSENGRFFANRTTNGVYQQEEGTLNPSSGVITVTGFIRLEGIPDKTYEYRLMHDGEEYFAVHEPGVTYSRIDTRLILSLLGGGKF